MLILLFVIVTDVILVILLISFLWTTLVGGVPYLATDEERVETMIRLAKLKKGDVACDLGSGDGRIVIALAEQGIEAHGYELNLMFVLVSQYKIWRRGLRNANIHWQNFMNVDVSNFDAILTFCISYTIPKLEEKLKKETKKGTRIVCHSYPLKGWKPEKIEDHVYLYVKK